MNLANQPITAYPKSEQLQHKQIKPSRRQRSELCAKEDKRLKERSGGVCERCDRQRATQRAHIERRWKSEDKPVAEEFAHLCVGCHVWADKSQEGRKWLVDFQKRLMEVAK